MQPKLFLDTNVVIDLLGERKPFYQSAARIATLADRKEVQIVISALTFATTYYVLTRFESSETVKLKIQKLKVITETSDLTDRVLEKGLSSNFKDFEDALQYFSATSSGCTHLITRNEKDFKLSEIPVFNPDEFLSSLKG